MQQHQIGITVFCRLIFFGKHQIAKSPTLKENSAAASFRCCEILRS